MHVFITGGTGLIGSAVVAELLGSGHTVLALARSDSSAAALETAGAEPLRGDLADLPTLRAGAAQADGVIHLAFSGDFSRPAALAQGIAEESAATTGFDADEANFLVRDEFVERADGVGAAADTGDDR